MKFLIEQSCSLSRSRIFLTYFGLKIGMKDQLGPLDVLFRSRFCAGSGKF